MFSIITPSLNQGPWLEECLASVREQGVEVEHLVMDGGSTDGTVAILRNQSSATWVSEPDRGQTDAINKGLRRSRGEILGYLCADDFYEPGALARVEEAFAADPSLHVVYGDGWFLEGSSGWKRRKSAGEFSPSRLRRGNFLIQPAVFWRRTVFERFGELDPTLQFCMDHEYWLRIAPYTRWQYLPEPLATCRLHGGAKTSRALTAAWQEAATMQARYGMILRPRLEALWMRCGGQNYYRLKRALFARIGREKDSGVRMEDSGGMGTSGTSPESRILNPESSIPNPESSIPNPESSILNPESSIPNPESLILNPKSSRLAIFELHHLGDAVLAVPFLRAARNRFETTVFCRPPVAGLLRELLPGLEVREVPATWPARWAAVRKLKLGARDVAVCVWADARVHLLQRASGAGRRVGLPMTQTNYYAADLPWRRRRMRVGQFLTWAVERLTGGPLLTDPLFRASPSQSHLENWSQLAAALGFAPDLSLPWIADRPIRLPDEVSEFLRHRTGRPVVLVHPGGRLPSKRWPKFQELLKRLAAAPSLAALIVQVPGEPVVQALGNDQLAVDSRDWPTLLGLIQSATVMVCNDSLASHLAAALGRPVVTIFGSGQPDWFAPYENRHRIVATDACRFRPCIDRCVMSSFVCLESVSGDSVMTRLTEVLAEVQSAPSAQW